MAYVAAITSVKRNTEAYKKALKMVKKHNPTAVEVMHLILNGKKLLGTVWVDIDKKEFNTGAYNQDDVTDIVVFKSPLEVELQIENEGKKIIK